VKPERTSDAIELTFYRAAFLEAASEAKPAILAELVQVLPLYGDYPLRSGRLDRIEAALSGRSHAPLRLELELWAAGHNLNVPWVIATAARTLRLWTHSTEALSAKRWSHPASGKMLGEPPTAFEVPNLTLASRADALAAFERYLDAQEAYLEQNGFRRPTDRRAAEEHLDWLIRYQVREESFHSIAQSVPRRNATGTDEGTSHQRISKAVKGLADFLCLPLR
jgi:hypothetical protein